MHTFVVFVLESLGSFPVVQSRLNVAEKQTSSIKAPIVCCSRESAKCFPLLVCEQSRTLSCMHGEVRIQCDVC